ncbi:protease inhibitor I42 family protein [Caulobacter sp. DWR2-3-1b2]|uniref:protease inhibitor I42 family protein n=1 Tax=unclassified Caulobacter TaxID=2648921 RepID=UPI00198C94BF|nr:protease inhibitor I42 family protein [Caulobacter sp.]
MKTLPALALATALLVAGCASAPPPPVRTVTDADAGAITLARGQGLEIALPLNSGTGYAWRLDEEAPILILGGGSSQITDAKMPGAPVQTIYRYQAVGMGKADLAFTLKQPWRPDSPSDRKVVFHIKVR